MSNSFGKYIAEDNIDAADRIIAEIFDALRTLAAHPHIGHRRPDLTDRPLRFQPVRDFLIGPKGRAILVRYGFQVPRL